MSSKNFIFNFNDRDYKKGLAEFICVEKLSFSFGEKCGLIKFLKSCVYSLAKTVSRNTTKKNILTLFKERKKLLIVQFAALEGRVSICSDIWIDNWYNHSYMGITVHFIDNSWQLHKKNNRLSCF